MKIKSVIVRLSEELHQQLKLKTVEQKTTIQELIENFIKNYVANTDNQKK